MVKARAFCYVAAGVFLLALSYHLGARNAAAQAPGNPVVAALDRVSSTTGGVIGVFTANGDIYKASSVEGPWVHATNIFSGPVPTTHETMGSVKAKYR